MTAGAGGAAFLLRRLVRSLIAPSLWGYVAVAVGIALLFFQRTRRAGGICALTGAGWLLLVSLGIPFGPVGHWLENRHPAIVDAGAGSDLEGVEWVVVLGGGHRADAGLPISAYLPSGALHRVVEGIRLHRALPGSRLLLTGNGGGRDRHAAEVGASLAFALGVDPVAVSIDGSPRTTAEEARVVRSVVGEGPVILVTSALHMPRAVRLFERAGVHVVPAPTGQSVVSGGRSVVSVLRPSPSRLRYADSVVRELVALAAVEMGLD